MAHARRFGSRTRGTGYRPARTWDFQTVAQTSVPDNTVGVLVASFQPISNDATILRQFLSYSMSTSDGGPLPKSMYQTGVGVCLITAEAFVAGIGSVPTPISQGDSDAWMLLDHVCFSSDGISQFRSGTQVGTKAMRKVQDGYVIALVVEQTDLLLSNAITMSFQWRVLP